MCQDDNCEKQCTRDLIHVRSWYIVQRNILTEMCISTREHGTADALHMKCGFRQGEALSVWVEHVYREFNVEVDGLANEGIDSYVSAMHQAGVVVNDRWTDESMSSSGNARLDCL